MYLYFALAAIVGLVAGIVIAARSKKAEDVVYGTLDKIGKVTNILLIPVYFVVSIFCFFIVMLGYFPEGEGILGVLSWSVAIIGATGPVLCGLGLGASVALRKKGKSKKELLGAVCWYSRSSHYHFDSRAFWRPFVWFLELTY